MRLVSFALALGAYFEFAEIKTEIRTIWFVSDDQRSIADAYL